MKIGDVAQLVEHYGMLPRGLGFNSSHLQSNSFYFGLIEDNQNIKITCSENYNENWGCITACSKLIENITNDEKTNTRDFVPSNLIDRHI